MYTSSQASKGNDHDEVSAIAESATELYLMVRLNGGGGGMSGVFSVKCAECSGTYRLQVQCLKA
jgi:hypothetical protein